MIAFEPFPIVINGNRRDDLLYELWQLGGSKPQEKPANLDEIELRESVGEEAKHYERTVFACLSRIGKLKSGRCVLAASLGLESATRRSASTTSGSPAVPAPTPTPARRVRAR